MKSSTAKVSTFLLCFCSILSSCISMTASRSVNILVTDMPTNINSITPTPMSNSQECIISEYKFDYQLGEIPPGVDWSGSLRPVSPPQEWKDVAHFSQPSSLLLLQERKGKIILWIYGNDGNLLRYNLFNSSSDNIEILPGPVSQSTPALHVDFDNNVWGSRGNLLYNEDDIPLLSRYNEGANQWEKVNFDIPDQDNSAISDLEFDEQGYVWFFVVSREEKGLYRLDPTTRKIERHLAEYNFDGYYPNFTISNNMLFISAISDVSVPIYSLIQYHIDNGKISVTPIPAKLQENYEGGRSTPNPSFIDSHKRVWFGARGWLDLATNQWHYIIPDPVFISVIPGAGEWRWVEPEPVLETSDGLIWYKASQATGWADPSKGVWCTFTSYSSNIFVDSFQRLWILVNDTLYMRQ